MGLLGAVISAAATAGLERAAAKLPKENRAPFERTNHRGETVTLLEGPIAVLGALARPYVANGLPRGWCGSHRAVVDHSVAVGIAACRGGDAAPVVEAVVARI